MITIPTGESKFAKKLSPTWLEKTQEVGELKGVDPIRGHGAFEEVMIADQVDY